MLRSVGRTLGGLLLPVLVLGAGALASERDEALAIVEAAKSRAKTIPAQAEALAELAWPDGGVDQPMVATLAREQLIGFQERGLAAMANRLRRTDPRFTADIVAALIESRLGQAGMPPEYLPALDDALWYGSTDAMRVAMFELARHRYRPAVLSAIDAAYDHPELTCTVIRALAGFRDDRARHYLREQVLDGPPRCRADAAQALAEIGARASETLREIAISEGDEARTLAIDALLPTSRVDDLTILYEYVAAFPDDDPDRLERVRQRALQLERLLESQQESEAATPPE